MAPLSVRGAVTAGMNFAIVLGQLIGFGVQRQTALFNDSRQYKILFATQWGYVAVGLLILPFLPEYVTNTIASGFLADAGLQVPLLAHGPRQDREGTSQYRKAASS